MSRQRGRSDELVRELGLGAGFSMDVAVRQVYLMLWGMALELLFKASIVAGEKEPKETHELLVLVDCARVEYTTKERAILEILTEAVIWEGRYPVPRAKKKDSMHKARDLMHRHFSEPVVVVGRDGPIPGFCRTRELDWDTLSVLWKKAEIVYRERAEPCAPPNSREPRREPMRSGCRTPDCLPTLSG